MWQYVKTMFKINGVETDVTNHGKLQPKDKVKRDIGRQAFEPMIDNFRPVTLPEAPPGVIKLSRIRLVLQSLY
ncbi:hypothetical protein N7540_012528 [Penicillium herquei]|nr:hypothetical protein N7540_012528 [Penicillium herquei]